MFRTNRIVPAGSSFPRKRESRASFREIPACAGMTAIARSARSNRDML